MTSVDIPIEYLALGEASDRAVIYVHDLPNIIAHHLERMADRQVGSDWPNGYVRELLLAEADALRDGAV